MSTSVWDDNKIPSTIVNKFSKESKDDFTHSLSFSYVCLSAFLYASLSLSVCVCVSITICVYVSLLLFYVCLSTSLYASLSIYVSLFIYLSLTLRRICSPVSYSHISHLFYLPTFSHLTYLFLSFVSLCVYFHRHLCVLLPSSFVWLFLPTCMLDRSNLISISLHFFWVFLFLEVILHSFLCPSFELNLSPAIILHPKVGLLMNQSWARGRCDLFRPLSSSILIETLSSHCCCDTELDSNYEFIFPYARRFSINMR